MLHTTNKWGYAEHYTHLHVQHLIRLQDML